MNNVDINMDDPPPFLAPHKDLLEFARTTMVKRLSEPTWARRSLDDIVIVASLKPGPRVLYSAKIVPLTEILHKTPDARMRAQLKGRPMPGFVRMVVSVGPHTIVLTARVRQDAPIALEDPSRS